MEDHDASGGNKTNDDSGGDKTKKRTRGPTNLKKEEGEGLFLLKWDKAGFPTGEYATKFASYCGKKVRCQVNINFEDWDKDVEVGLKNLLWQDISEKSQKAVESIKHNEHPHIMGRRGYNQRISEWITSSSNSEVTDRSWCWIKGRSKSDGEIPNEKTKKVQEEMVEWRKKVELGEFVPHRYDDVLSRSLNKKEHCGRVRGFPSGVTIKDVFGTAHQTSQRSVGISDQEVAKITERVRNDTIKSLSSLIRQEVRQEAVGMLKRMGFKVPEDMDELQSSCQSAVVHGGTRDHVPNGLSRRVGCAFVESPPTFVGSWNRSNT